MQKKIELYIFLFSILFFSVTIFSFEEIFKNNLRNQFLLIIIPLLWPGIAHGSLDLHIAQRLKFVENKFNLLLFSFGYILIATAYFILWLINSELSLYLFLLISIIHFGISDTLNTSNTKFFYFELFLRGTIPIIVPIIFYEQITDSIFSLLSTSNNLSQIINQYLYFYFVILLIVFFKDLCTKKLFIKEHYYQSLIEIFFIFLCFVSFEPLIAFSIYFCFLHSIRHLFDEKIKLKFTTKKLIKATLPLTLITTIIMICIYYMIKDFEYIYISLLFIILSCLTVPHMLLVNFTKS